jgi:hypothetical protein
MSEPEKWVKYGGIDFASAVEAAFNSVNALPSWVTSSELGQSVVSFARMPGSFAQYDWTLEDFVIKHKTDNDTYFVEVMTAPRDSDDIYTVGAEYTLDKIESELKIGSALGNGYVLCGVFTDAIDEDCDLDELFDGQDYIIGHATRTVLLLYRLREA